VGWLRELMATCEPPIPSYGDLARRCLESQQWPRDIQPQARSLASLFSKFDRGMEVEWLAERREVQHVIAQTLGLPLRAVEHEVLRHVGNADRNLNRFRFLDAPNARPIDLREEDLPDIFHPRLTRPGLWDKLWWTTPPGSAHELLAKWLHARALAESATCETWADVVLGSTSGVTPLLVEYLGPAPSTFDLQLLGARPLCICSHLPAPPGLLAVPAIGAAEVEDALLEWLLPLWVQPAEVPLIQLRAWLNRLRGLGLGSNLEALLGLVSLAYDVGLEKLEALSLIELVQFFLRKTIQQSSFVIASEGTWLQDHVYDVLRGMARNALANVGTQWNTSLTQADWLNLIPSEYQRGVDAEWTRVSLQQAGAPLTVSELEKALKAVPPGGFRVIESLRTAQILREGAGAKLSIRPRWVADFFESAGYSCLLEESADSWGQVALDPRRTKGVTDALTRELAASVFRTLDAALELDDDESPGYALAIELLVVTTGRQLLLGKEFEPEQVGGLLRLQQGQLVNRSTTVGRSEGALLPSPRLLASPANLNSWGEWLLSVWALCEHATDVSELASANPWELQPVIEPAALSLVINALEHLEPLVVAGTYRLFGRLLVHLQQASKVNPKVTPTLNACLSHPLFSVARVLRGDGWDAWELALRAPHGIASISATSSEDAWPSLARTAWRTWNEKGSPAVGLELFSNPRHRQAFWPHLPDRVLKALLDERHSIVLQVPSECMKAEWVTMYLERVPENSELARQYLEVIPMAAITEEHFEVLFELLEAHAFAERVMGLWEGHGQAGYQRLLVLLDAGKTAQAQVWLATLPETQLNPLTTHLRSHIERVGTRYPSFEACRVWVHDLCCNRKPGWQSTYDLLSDMEVRLKRVARAAPITITPAD
jgi:hypothetical protein